MTKRKIQASPALSAPYGKTPPVKGDIYKHAWESITMKTILVVAGTLEAFRYFRMDKNRYDEIVACPRTTEFHTATAKYVYIHSAKQLRGRRGVKVIFVEKYFMIHEAELAELRILAKYAETD